LLFAESRLWPRSGFGNSTLKKTIFNILVASLATLVLTTEPAAAYIGPGVGVGVIGSVLGVFFGFFMMLFALIWYPIKRTYVRLKQLKKNLQVKSPIS
jgi:hypothetical protein